MASESVRNVGETDVGAVPFDLEWQHSIDKDVGGEEDGEGVSGY